MKTIDFAAILSKVLAVAARRGLADAFKAAALAANSDTVNEAAFKYEIDAERRAAAYHAIPAACATFIDACLEADGTLDAFDLCLFLSDCPAVGKGVTTGYGSDCYPGTITFVAPNFKSFRYTDDRVDGDVFTSTPEVEGHDGKPCATVCKLSRARGTAGRYVRHGSNTVTVGYRRSYRDPHF